jgi:hypothetical protein
MVTLRETSNYPSSGDIRIAIDPEAPVAFQVKLRVPGWCRGASISVNGQPVAANAENGYVTIDRTWSKGDIVMLDLPMPAERLYAHPGVIMDAGRVALKRGPLVYCVEEADNPGGRVQRLRLPRVAELKSSTRADLFGGTVTLSAKAKAIVESGWDDLYRTEAPGETDATLTALPYYLWANRGHGSMVVWIPEA